MAKKAQGAFRTISEVADWLDIPAHVLRFWESKFSQIKPVKRAGGRRYYRPEDMQLIGGIKKLLHDDGLTIRGVQKMLSEEGVKEISTHSPPLDMPSEEEAARRRAERRAKRQARSRAARGAAPPAPPDETPPATDSDEVPEAPYIEAEPEEEEEDADNVLPFQGRDEPGPKPEPEPEPEMIAPSGGDAQIAKTGSVSEPPNDPRTEDISLTAKDEALEDIMKALRRHHVDQTQPAAQVSALINRLKSLRARIAGDDPAP